MTQIQPTPLRAIFLCGVGVFFWLGFLPVQAQTPPPESGRQMVMQAEILLRQPAANNAEQAIRLYQTAAASFHQTGEIEAEALAWHRIAQLATKAGKAQEGKTAADKARTLLRVRTLPTRTAAGLSTSQAARAYLTLGRIHLESGEMKAAVESYQTGLAMAVDAHLHREAAAGHVALGLMAGQAEEYETAIRMTTKSLEFWRAAKDFRGEAMALNNLARFYERKGEIRLAADFDAEAASLMRFSRNYKGEGESLVEAMRLHLIMGNYDEAAYACEQLIAVARLNGEAQKEREYSMTLATLEAQRDNLPSAYRVLLKAMIGGAQTDIGQIKGVIAKLESLPKNASPQKGREQVISEAEFEAKRGDFSAAYQLLLRALLLNEGKSDALNATLHARIKTLTRQIEAQQKKRVVTHSSRFN